MKFKELKTVKEYNPERVIINELRFYSRNKPTNQELIEISPSINTLLSFVSDTKDNITYQVDNWLNKKYKSYENIELLKEVQKQFWTVRGDIIHKCMEDSIHNEKIVNEWEKSEDFKNLIYQIAKLEDTQHIPKEISPAKLYEGVNTIFQNFIDSFDKFSHIIWCLSETKMWAAFAAGTADAGYLEPDTSLTIFDLKTTSKKRGYNYKYHNEKLIDYILQMVAYGRMAEEMFNVKCNHVHLFSVNPENVEEVKIPVDSKIMNKKYEGMSYNELLNLKIRQFKRDFSLV